MAAIRAVLVLCLCFALVLPESTSVAAAIVVDSLADTIANDNHCTLREAIRAANLDLASGGCIAGSGADTIQLPKGTVSIAREGRMENEALTGDFDILESVSIVGAGRDLTIIDGMSLDRIFDVPGDGVVFQLSDLTIRGGYPSYDPEVGWPEEEPQFGWGGGVRVLQISSSLAVSRVRFTDNLVDQSEDGHGAGIFAGGPLEVRDSIFNANYAGLTGGAITSTRHLLVTDTFFEENHGYGAAAIEIPKNLANSGGRMENVYFSGHGCGPTAGGVIDIGESTNVEIVNFVIETSDCEAETIQNYGNLTLIDGWFRSNSAIEGIINHHDGILVVQNTWFTSNRAQGIVNITGGKAVIEQSFFSGSSGAGLRVEGGVVEMTNVTISTASSGSGVLVEGGALKLESVSLANLQGDSAALEVNDGQVIIHNTLIANNRDPAGTPRDCMLAPGTTASQGYNLIGVSDGCGWRAATGDQIGTLAAPVNPMLGPLTSATGGTQTQPPLPGSPAIDAADPGLCPVVDQRGVDRPQGSRCDIGAHEVDTASLMIFHVYLPRMAGP